MGMLKHATKAHPGESFRNVERTSLVTKSETESSFQVDIKSDGIKDLGQRRTEFRTKRRKREEIDKEPLEKCDLCDYVPKIPNRNSIRVHKEAQHLGVRHDCLHC